MTQDAVIPPFRTELGPTRSRIRTSSDAGPSGAVSPQPGKYSDPGVGASRIWGLEESKVPPPAPLPIWSAEPGPEPRRLVAVVVYFLLGEWRNLRLRRPCAEWDAGDLKATWGRSLCTFFAAHSFIFHNVSKPVLG